MTHEEEELPKDWTQATKEYVDFPVGETTFQVVGEPYLRKGQFGIRLHVPTNLGVWALNVEGKIAAELAKWNRQLGKLSGCAITLVRTGREKETRYSIKQLNPPKTSVETVPPPHGQSMLTLSADEIATIEQMRKEKEQPKK